MKITPQDWVSLGKGLAGILFSLYRPTLPKVENPKPTNPTILKVAPAMSKPKVEEAIPSIQSVEQIIEREKGGDYCISCVGSKHLMRAKDALLDALNIAKGQNKFTDVAESKVQRAVYELNAAEVDLEQAKAPEVIRPAVSEMHTQIRKIRDFLRQDISGLELATTIPEERFKQAKNDLESAMQSIDEMIKHGYQLTKIQLKARAEELRKSKSNA